MICNRCGKCCKSTFFALCDVPVNKDTREIGRWASYHGVKTMKYPIDGIDYLAVSLPNPCQFLEEKDGKCSCIIYDKRPQVCKDYWCKAHNLQELIDKTAKELEEKCITSSSKE